MKTALVCGVGGQDGAYLSQFLLRKGYKVFGTSRDASGRRFFGLEALGLRDQVNMMSMDVEDFRSVVLAIEKSNPDEVYFLAGQSSVGLSFDEPSSTVKSISLGTLNILEACRLIRPTIKQYYAGSGECFGDTGGARVNENHFFSPCSPYAIAKAAAYWLVKNYRESYNLFACTGILFNHESPLRPSRFVTQKIVQAVKDISAGRQDVLILGRLDIARDWGWAPDYVEAMYLMLQQDYPEDFVIATGYTFSLQDFVSTAFDIVGLDWRDFVVQDKALFRPSDILINAADPSKAKAKLGWSASLKGRSLVTAMMGEENKILL